MELTDELKTLLLKDPNNIQDFPNASKEMQMLCVKESPWSLVFIENPFPEVILEAYRREHSLISDNPNPTEEQQIVAATSGGSGVIGDIKNPCRAAALIILEKRGDWFRQLTELQEKLGNAFAASAIPLLQDIELQSAALSNITGLTLFNEQQTLFDRNGLEAVYPGILAVLDTWCSLGFDYHDCELIRDNLHDIKNKVHVPLSGVTLPNDFAP